MVCIDMFAEWFGAVKVFQTLAQQLRLGESTDNTSSALE